MSGIVQREGNRFDATYTNPWGGVASDCDNSDIQPSQLVQGDGVLIRTGRLCVAGWGNSTLYNYSDTASKGYFQGINIQRTLLIKINNGSWVTVAFDNNGHAYYYDPGGKVFAIDKTLSGGSVININCIQVINGVAYIFDFNAHSVYRYEPFVSYTVASTYVGGKYCMVLKGYLVTANTNQASDTPAIKENRYNWCAPFAYSTWDPAVDRTAGFNTLSSAQDQISGMFAMGNVGFILRTQGLTQMTPTGDALAPFSLDDLWASKFGIGCTYPDTFDQYGSLAIWANNSNIYGFFSGTVPQEITGSAQLAIFKDINQYELDPTIDVRVSGAFSNTCENGKTPELLYVLTIVSTSTDTNNTSVPTGVQAKIWTLNVSAKAWTRQVFNIGTAIRTITGNNAPFAGFGVALSTGVQEPNAISLLTTRPPRRIATNLQFSISIGGTFYSFLFALYYNSTGYQSLTTGKPPDPVVPFAEIGLALLFREEETKLGAKPTVRGVIVKAAGSGTLSIRVNTHSFTDITLDGSAQTKVYKSHGEVSEENPSLLITSQTADAYIVKANMSMTYQEGEVV